MKSFLTLLYLILSVLGGLLNAQTCVVNSQTLNMRKSAGTESQIITTLTAGQQVQLLQDATLAGWVKVMVGNTEGYVLKKYLSCSKPKVEKQENTVWVCLGGSAYAYHNNNGCSGLRRCRAQILRISESDAKNKYSRRPCRICY